MAGGKNVKTPPDQPLTSSPPGSFIFPTALQGEEDSRQLKRFGLESTRSGRVGEAPFLSGKKIRSTISVT